MEEDIFVKAMRETEEITLGKRTSFGFDNDPRQFVFSLSRYKFVSKMFADQNRVLEVGCGDCFGSTIVAQSVNKLYAIDIEAYGIEENRSDNKWLREKTVTAVHDMTSGPFGDDPFDAVFSLDVIEHIPEEEEDKFLANIVKSAKPAAPLIIGTPNEASAEHASKMSRIGHINMKSYDSLKETLSRHYQQVFMFGMNDEVLHTGFGPMCHYLFALAVQPKKL